MAYCFFKSDQWNPFKTLWLIPGIGCSENLFKILFKFLSPIPEAENLKQDEFAYLFLHSCFLICIFILHSNMNFSFLNFIFHYCVYSDFKIHSRISIKKMSNAVSEKSKKNCRISLAVWLCSGKGQYKRAVWVFLIHLVFRVFW